MNSKKFHECEHPANRRINKISTNFHNGEAWDKRVPGCWCADCGALIVAGEKTLTWHAIDFVESIRRDILQRSNIAWIEFLLEREVFGSVEVGFDPESFKRTCKEKLDAIRALRKELGF